MAFDHINTAKTVIGQLVTETGASFQDALTLQAALRILLPSAQLSDIAAPKIFPNDPLHLQELQGIVLDRLGSLRDATPEEQQLARTTLADIAPKLGNTEFAQALTGWLNQDAAPAAARSQHVQPDPNRQLPKR